jgi:hypothetical protein
MLNGRWGALLSDGETRKSQTIILISKVDDKYVEFTSELVEDMFPTTVATSRSELSLFYSWK